MERRLHKRIAVGYKTEIIYGGKSYEGVIENISATGVSVISASTKGETDFKPMETLELKFEPGLGETVTLLCRIKWSRKTQPHLLTNKLGLEIIDPSWEQSAFFV